MLDYFACCLSVDRAWFAFADDFFTLNLLYNLMQEFDGTFGLVDYQLT